jgi:GH35 family endo-1,4-beta-xylanase
LGTHFALCAQSIPQPKIDLINQSKLGYIKLSRNNLGRIAGHKVDGIFEYTVSTDTFVENHYNLSISLPLIQNIVLKGEKLLLSFEAKTVASSIETGEARVAWVLNTSKKANGKIKKISSIPSDWKTIYVLFEPNAFIAEKVLNLNMQFGFPPQEFLIRNLKLDLYDAKTDTKLLPTTQITYAGMEADAQWRKLAFQRIDSLRKGDIHIKVYKDGKIVPNALVDVRMLDHHFKWGAAVRAEDLQDTSKISVFRKFFNLAVLENDLKMKHWLKNKELTLEIIDKLRAKGISVKGHVLVWPGLRYLPLEYVTYKNSPEKISKLTMDHVREILKETEGKIDIWDVVNECYSNQDLQKMTASNEILYEPFRFLKQNYPDVKRYINEFGIISNGGLNKIKQDWYFNMVKEIDQNTDQAIDGIGMQCHIGNDLTYPVKILSILDRFGKLGKRIAISEFTLDIEDPRIRKMYTEDVLIAAFSHPNVTEFLFWGYEGNGQSKVDIIDSKGSLGSMGQGFQGLVHGLWKTKFKARTNVEGKILNRGYYGSYEYILDLNGKTIKGTFDHKPDRKTELVIEI